jgi:predicted RNA-binding Zn ribbon-like protein
VASAAKENPDRRLELVREFINTKDVDHDTDALASRGELADWLVAEGLAGSDQGTSGHGTDNSAPGGSAPGGGLVVGPTDLRRAIDFREALRAVLLANNDGEAPEPAAVAVLNRIAQRAKLVTHFDERGTAALEPVSGSVDGALGRLLAIVHDAIETGDWRRLKACRNDTCLWAFYDTSKNRSRHWCSMDSCGSQVKARTYRQRKKVGPPVGTTSRPATSRPATSRPAI